MALPFKKKLEGKGYIPIERVKNLASKGFSEPEIIDILRGEGFSPEEIDKGLTRALKEEVEEVAPPPPTPPPPPPKKEEPKVPTLEEITPPEKLEVPEVSLPPEKASNYTTEEYIDYVVEERVFDIYERINDLREKQAELERKISELSEKIEEIVKARAEERITMSKVEETKDLIGDVSARVGGLEKAFKETLPVLLESIRTLSELVKRTKKSS